MAKLDTSGMSAAQKAQVAKTQKVLKETGGQGYSTSSDVASLQNKVSNLKSQATSLANKQGKNVSWDDSGTATMTAIPLDSLNKNITPIAVPSPTTPAPTNYESGLSTLGLMKDASGNWSVPTTPEGNTAQDTFKAYLGSLKAPESTADAYEAARREAGIAKKEKLVNAYKSDLANIVNSAKAEQLKLEGQGRGQTTGFIGGEQARISREAAIQALPVEAQLSAAQDDLKTAETKLDTLFKLKVSDAEAKNNFYNKMVDAVYGFATKQEQQRLDEIKQQKADNITLLRDATGFAQQAALQALKDGNTSLFSKITSSTVPDTNSKTFSADLARYNSSIMSSIGNSGNSNGVVTLSTADNAKLNSTPQAEAINNGARFAAALKDYRKAIETHGTGEVFGRGSGEINSAYQTVVGAIKDYYKLGTLDNGVEKLVALGIPKPSIWGIKSARIGGIDQQLSTLANEVGRNAEQLGKTAFANSQEAQNLIQIAKNLQEEIKLKDVSNNDLLNSLPKTTSPLSGVMDNYSFFNSIQL